MDTATYLQSQAYSLAKDGHRVLVTGQAGSGKTWLMVQICQAIQQDGKKVAVVCPTGIAATNYGQFNGTTVHRLVRLTIYNSNPYIHYTTDDWF